MPMFPGHLSSERDHNRVGQCCGKYLMAHCISIIIFRKKSTTWRITQGGLYLDAIYGDEEKVKGSRSHCPHWLLKPKECHVTRLLLLSWSDHTSRTHLLVQRAKWSVPCLQAQRSIPQNFSLYKCIMGSQPSECFVAITIPCLSCWYISRKNPVIWLTRHII